MKLNEKTFFGGVNMSEKICEIETYNEIYLHLLRIGTIHLRNILERPLYKSVFRKDSLHLANLLHLIPPVLQSESKDRGDEYFIDKAIKFYSRDFSDKSDPYFIQECDLILELKENLEKDMGKSLAELPKEISCLFKEYRVRNNKK